MKTKPILFNGEMVRAILDGRKTQTRRVIRGPGNAWHIDRLLGEWALSSAPEQWDGEKYPWRWQGKKTPRVGDWIWSVQTDVDDTAAWPIRCPYGEPGGLLWVRETQWVNGGYVATDKANYANEGKTPSIFMRRADSRLTLRVLRVWVERVQDISHDDALAEGCPDSGLHETYERPDSYAIVVGGGKALNRIGATGWFAKLWDKINAKRGFGWEVNPWVWCIEFEVAE